MALDAKSGIVYVPTASPSFDFYGADRAGQNLFANCLLALDGRTGKRIWHFQTTHHDLWDRDNGSPPNLVNVAHNGKSIDAVALVTKLGYVFLFDRKNGDPLFDIKEVPVPATSEMPGEKPWPTQPFPAKPAPFARQGFRKEYYSNIDSGTNTFIENEIKKNGYNTGVYDPPNLRGSIVVPAAHGGANWGGASYNPHSGILFVNSTDVPWFQQLREIKSLVHDNQLQGKELFKKYCSSCHGMDRKGTNYGPNIVNKVNKLSVPFLDNFIKKGAEPMPSFKHLPQVQLDAIISFIKNIEVKSQVGAGATTSESPGDQPYGFSGYDFFNDEHGIPAIKPPFGTLNAIDLNKGEILWQVPLGEDKKLAKIGIPRSGMYNRGGGIATAGGLIFIAATADRMFRAFEQSTGSVIWETELPADGRKRYDT
ncbi:MAG: PQQ-binding-like beta-propeller repeat protein [Chitinophagaceae bacterium]|nr:PQQ-binding-like beta-propeller repeat protein [Chitinophagaceae bacterium]